jgi:ferrochelatase
VREAQALLPESARDEAPVLFSAHGLPESYIERGDPYLDDIRITVAAVTRRLGFGPRAQLCFQSRLGRKKWLGPYTEHAIDRLAEAGHTALLICPIAFTGEHIETLQEIDILYRERAAALGITHFARARTVGCHPAFINALATLAIAAARGRGWVPQEDSRVALGPG